MVPICAVSAGWGTVTVLIIVTSAVQGRDNDGARGKRGQRLAQVSLAGGIGQPVPVRRVPIQVVAGSGGQPAAVWSGIRPGLCALAPAARRPRSQAGRAFATRAAQVLHQRSCGPSPRRGPPHSGCSGTLVRQNGSQVWKAHPAMESMTASDKMSEQRATNLPGCGR